MRVERWKAKEIFSQIAEEAIAAGNDVMDEVVMLARNKCPIGHITREGKFTKANVSITSSFTPSKGKNKGITRTTTAQFFTNKRWTGRNPGDLRATIRRVERKGRRGNIWVMAGNYKIYWAHMIEYGTVQSKMQSFLRPALHQIKTVVNRRIEEGIGTVAEVKR